VTKVHYRASYQVINNLEEDEDAESLDEYDQEEEGDRVISKV